MSYELSHFKKSHNKIDRFKLLHKKKSVLVIDRLVMTVGVLSPLTAIPQIVEILEAKSAVGVSTLAWIMYVVIGIFWLVYGIAHREKIIIINNLLWIILEIIIVILSLVY